MPDRRLVTLTGPGGVGKTRLALEIAGRGAIADIGVAGWVDLAPSTCAGDVDAALLRALGLAALPAADPARAMIESLMGRPGWLIIDNCEQVLDHVAALVERLLHSCPELCVLATSRAPLGIDGERRVIVDPLALEPHENGGMADAVELFIARAGDAGAKLPKRPEAEATILAICRELEGMPLAIELAAAQTGVMSLVEILEGLGSRLPLAGSRRRAPARLQAVRASIEWSWELLGPEERRLVSQLAVFVGSFDAGAARAVCSNGDGDPGDQMMVLLEGLVRASIVLADTSGALARYRLLRSVRELALEHLEPGDAAQVRDRHLTHFAEFAARADPMMSTTDHAAVDRAAPDLLAALEHACSTGRQESLELVGRLGLYWAHSSWLERGAQLSARAVAEGPQLPSPERALALTMVAALDFNRGNFDAALAALAECEPMIDGVAGLRARGWFEGLRATMQVVLDPCGGRPAIERAIELAERAGDRVLQSHMLITLAVSHDVRDDRAGVESAVARTIAVAEELELTVPLRWAYWCLARQALLGGELGAAHAALDRALDHGSSSDMNFAGGAESLRALAELYAGEEPAARIQHALELCEAGAPWLGQGNAQFVLAMYALAQGDLAGARRWGLALTEQAVGAHLPVHGHEVLMYAALAGGEGDVVCQHAKALDQLSVRFENRRAAALARYGEGAAALLDGDATRAERLLLEALGDLLAGGYIPAAADALERLAATLALQGREQRASRLAGAAQAARKAIGARSLLPAAMPPAPDPGLSLSAARAYALRGLGRRSRPTRGWAALTPAEFEVAELAAAGLSNPRIAERLFVTVPTVKTHLHHVYGKLGVANRTELAGHRKDHPGG